MNSEPTHFLTFMNTSKAFSSLDGMQLLRPVSISTRTLTSQKLLNSYKTQLKINLNNTRNNIKSQIKNKKNGPIVELLIPTLNKIIRNQGTYFVVITNKRLKIISVPMWCSPAKYGRVFSKKTFMRGQKLFWEK